MNIFRNVVFLAALAGLCAGIVMTALQSFATVPLILQAETFEGAEEPAHDHGAAPAPVDTTAQQAAPAAEDHHHDPEAWAPADGFERSFYTGLANIVTGIGFALLLVVASEFAGGMTGWRNGLFWGLAGFAVFTLAPSLGLPPGLPGMPIADTVSRQIWWISTAGATAAGLALMVYGRSALFAVIGLVLIAVPHIIGAPQPDTYESAVPAGLHHQFIVAVTVTTLMFGSALGMVTGALRQRMMSEASEPQPRLA